ncbi:6-phospho-3-hexuloisomerase [Paenibacillus gansuensis]|uniref:6-phospho-3-hexuloisomerase n=1 Tax=Paenibacillus gansuensis TaxID=306542 RepID=A0ABW5PA15_9BACL
MQVADYTDSVIAELQRVLKAVPGSRIDELAARILDAEQIFVAGAGRSGLMLRAGAMRLHHMGFRAYVVGETVTPGITPRDLLIVGSGSGETKTLTTMAAKAKAIGASVIAITTAPESTIGSLSDAVVAIPAAPKEQNGSHTLSVQPMGSLFEQALLLLLDSLVLALMDQRKTDGAAMFGNHANLE